MAISTTTLGGGGGRLGLVLLLAALIFMSCSSINQVMAQNCKNKSALGSLVSQCSNYVMKSGPQVKPSPSCCKAVKAVNVQCVCSYVTKDIEQIVDMKKVVFVAQSCGKKIKSGSKCGSYTINQNKN